VTNISSSRNGRVVKEQGEGGSLVASPRLRRLRLMDLDSGRKVRDRAAQFLHGTDFWRPPSLR
jgi:hypothetical protein